MNQIFKGAAKVIVWLGPDPALTAQKAFELMTTIYGVFQGLQKDEYSCWEKHIEASGDLSKSETWSPVRDIFEKAWVRDSQSANFAFRIRSNPV